jgi:phage-related holin
MKIKEYMLSVMHLKTYWDLLVNIVVASVAGVLGYFHLIYLNDPNVFQAIAWVVGVDYVLGMARALKHNSFETHKSLKIIWYLVVYAILAAMVLKIEDGFPSAFWLSEAFLMPILLGQVVSAAKNAYLLGVIKNEQLGQILEKIDKHKNKDNEGNQNQEGQSPSL